MRFVRHFRAAPMDYVPPRLQPSAYQGLHRAEMAERTLRARLLENPSTPAQLIAPERATVQHIIDGTLVGSTGGPLDGAVFGWAPDSDWLPVWIHSPHLLAELECDDYEPDPSCDEYAAHGSYLLRRPRIERLRVSPFLAPLAASWSEQYGVEVHVGGGEDVPAPTVPVLPPVVVPGFLTPEVCALLWDLFRHSSEDPIPLLPCRGIEAPQPIQRHIGAALMGVARDLDLPVTSATGQLMDYLPGEKFTEHTDAYPGLALSLDRTLSASVLLNQAGRDYEGGELYVNGEKVEANAGDAVFFTATTPHKVTPITAGHRFVFVMFGEVIR